MKEIKVSRGQYRMILRNDLIKQAADKAKYGKAIYAQRVDNMVGRLTARALDKDVQFNKSLKNWRDAIQARASAGRPWQKAKALVKEFQARTSVGRQWHSKAKEIGKKAHQRIVRLGLAPKRTTFSVEKMIDKVIKNVRVRGAPDRVVRYSGKHVAITDWKGTDRTAMSIKNVKQADKHAKLTGGKIVSHLARSWHPFLRSHAPQAAKNMPPPSVGRPAQKALGQTAVTTTRVVWAGSSKPNAAGSSPRASVSPSGPRGPSGPSSGGFRVR